MNHIENLRQISTQDLAGLGLNHVAYIRSTMIDAQPGFAIFAADGTQLAVMPTLEAALAVLHRNDLEAVTLH